MSTVETVLGRVDAGALGCTLSHEHVLVAMGEDNHHYRWLFDWDRTRANAVRELSEAKTGGVDTIIDLTTPDLGRDVEFVRDVARASHVNVVVATGIWRDVPRSFWARDVDRIADIFVREIEIGIGDTGIKAGVIKVANDVEGGTPEAERVLRGAARALKRTGCPISTHQWAPSEVGRRQVEIFEEEGAPMDRICIGHSADTTDVDYLESLLRQGVYLSMDRYPGGEGRPDWRQRNATVKSLIDRGWAHRLMLGHDHAPAPVPVKRIDDGAPPGVTRYLFVPTVALPALRADGVTPEAIDMMMREVPRRFLSGAR
jgi:phosphotriesterase-related protein